MTLPKLILSRRSGAEAFHANGRALGFDLQSFWRWAMSDLVENTTRGVLAEYLVARALGLAQNDVRDAWAPADLVTHDGVMIQVKSAAFLQSWFQKKLSNVVFNVAPTRSWDFATNVLGKKAERVAHVYVFALLAHEDKATVDPLNVHQWEFYVLPVSVLNARKRSQHSITLKSLRNLTPAVDHAGLRQAIARANRTRASNDT